MPSRLLKEATNALQCVAAGRPFGIVVDLAGLPVHVLVGQPQMVDARSVELLTQAFAIGRDGAATGLGGSRRALPARAPAGRPAVRPEASDGKAAPGIAKKSWSPQLHAILGQGRVIATSGGEFHWPRRETGTTVVLRNRWREPLAGRERLDDR